MKACSFCNESTKWGEVLNDGRVRCAACIPCRFFEKNLTLTGDFAGKPFLLMPWQRKLLRDIFGTLDDEGLRVYKDVFTEVPTGSSKALALNTPIPTPSGWTTMGDIRIGDKVLDDAGNPCSVTSTSDVFIGNKCYEILFNNGERVIADADHLWLTSARINLPGVRDGRMIRRWGGPKLRIRTTRSGRYALAGLRNRTVYLGLADSVGIAEKFEELARQDTEHDVADSINRVRSTAELFRTQRSGVRNDLNHSVRMCEPLQLPDEDLLIDPYVLGAWIGDGTSVSSSITCGDVDQIELSENIKAVGYSVDAVRRKTAWTLRIRSTELLLNGDRVAVSGQSEQNFKKQLRRIGVLGKKHIPAQYLRASYAQRLSLLQGLMDTDGCINKPGHHLSYTTTSELIADGVAELLATMGIKFSVARRSMTCNGRPVSGTSIQISFYATRDKFQVFRLRRKLDRMRTSAQNPNAPRNIRIQIASIKEVESVATKCISVDSASCMYLCGRTMVPTHNTSFCAGLVLFFLVCNESRGTEIYSAATAKDQAGITFRMAQQMVLASPMLRRVLKVLPSTKRILRRDDPTSFYAAISADGDIHDGMNPSFVVRDELHRWRTRKQLELNEVLERKIVKRLNPLIWDITTAGEMDESPLCYQRHEYTRQVNEGIFDDRRFYGRIWAADAKRIESEPEYWASKEARVLANPSHEDNGGYMKDEVLLDLCTKAQNDPKVRADYLRYHLNYWGTKDTSVVDMPQWVACGGGVDLRLWPSYDADLLYRKWNLMERPCYAGVDASATTDLTALSFVFPPYDGDPNWTLMAFFWMAEGQVAKRERYDKVPYGEWVKKGFIATTPGMSIDFDLLKQRVRWASEIFDLRQVCFDPYGFRETAKELAKEEFAPLVDIAQRYLRLSEPTKKLLALYQDGKLRHGNNPVLNWNAKCLALSGDSNDNVMPDKPIRSKHTKRIDGIAATVTAMAQAILMEDETIKYTGLQSVGVGAQRR